jgi:CDP-diacylglycerol--serine O-phosphatidyltransferase
MNIKAAVPNSITLGNLAFGITGIVLTFQTNMLGAAICMVLAAVLDFFDGLAARALGVSGEFGKQLDSLADMVTFGVLPAIMLYQYITIGLGDYFIPIDERSVSHLAMEFSGFIYGLFAALRLAQFNIDENQSDSFIGVPSPAAALFVASFSLILSVQYNLNMYFPLNDAQLTSLVQMRHWTAFDFHLVYNLFNPNWYIFMSVFLSAMMVAPVTMLNFKFKEMSWNGNKERYIFLILVAVLVLVTFLPYWIRIPGFPYLDYAVIPLIVLLYMVYSLGVHFLVKNSEII